ncbi:MAG: tRNA lysidine(34) synthetase TilS [Oscillospiraceae bacterium]|nr:tRNA lysidine(34) synthetase TilS [Oscillospiraceae bacterium]
MMSGLIKKILAFADQFNMLSGSGLVLACVSGGADSMCLLEVLLQISREREFDIGVLHYNHALRGEESDRDEAFTRESCMKLGVPYYPGRGDVMAYAKRTGTGLEEAAREMRYSFFFGMAAEMGAKKIATAHTADDNAETIIMNLARGAGAKGLSGIPPMREKDGATVIRPMLRVSRDEILSFMSRQGLPFVVDSTNSLDIYTRNKIRRTVMPVIREINPRFNETAAAVSELLRADEEYLSGIADRFLNNGDNGWIGGGGHDWSDSGDHRWNDNGDYGWIGDGNHSDRRSFRLDARQLLELPLAISGRSIRKICGGSLSYKHVKAVLELCGKKSPSASLSLPGMDVYREYNNIVFSSRQDVCPDEQERREGCQKGTSFEIIYPFDGSSIIIHNSGLKMSCKCIIVDDTINGQIPSFNKTFTSFLFKHAEVYGRITVRPRREKDKMKILGHKSSKSIKKLFIERRIPAHKRQLVPVIADDKGVLAIYGVGRGNRAVPSPGDLVFQITFEDIELI